MIQSIELEWRDSLFLRYIIKPLDLLGHCDGCGAEVGICHVLDCNKGGFITTPHNEIYDEVANLARKEFTPTHMRDNPNIYTSRFVREGNDKLKG